MIKAIDKLTLKDFAKTFLLTFVTVMFILLIFALMRKFKYFVGKGLGFDTYSEFFFFFSMVLIPVGMQIAILLASLITFGNLSEHSEVTAVKSTGVNLVRLMKPVFILASLITVGMLFFTDKVVPFASLKSYSLLYDVKETKPTFELTEGIFYNGLPGYSIRVEKKYEDGKTVKGVMIYDHQGYRGNTKVIIADSAIIKNDLEHSFMKMELFNGNIYVDVGLEKGLTTPMFTKNSFSKSELYFSLDSYSKKNTREELFLGHNIMKSTLKLTTEQDSVKKVKVESVKKFKTQLNEKYFPAPPVVQSDSSKKDSKKVPVKSFFYNDSTLMVKKKIIKGTFDTVNLNQFLASEVSKSDMRRALVNVKSVQSLLQQNQVKLERTDKYIRSYEIDIYRRFADAIAVFIMFLIGAPLGTLIRKGGLGVPVITAIVAFAFYYIIMLIGLKIAKEGFVSPFIGCWISHFICAILGGYLFYLSKKDAFVFDLDYYSVTIKTWLKIKN